MMARMGMVTDDPLCSREASEASDVISKQGREQPVAFFQLSLWSPLQHLFIKVNFCGHHILLLECQLTIEVGNIG